MVTRPTTAEAARARIASLVLGSDGPATTIGRFILRQSQVRACSDISRAFDHFGGALLCDPPGTGKTIVALATAASHRCALVVAPAALRAHWRLMSERAEVPIAFASMESLSRGAVPTRAPLVIVDEAHHVRTCATRRYSTLSTLCLGARVLLLTATPVVNRVQDRDALLALFLGTRARALSAEELARCLIRRLDGDTLLPRVRRIAPLHVAVPVPGLADALRSLPPPLPVREGGAATSLISISLALCWHSSLAALDCALRRRIQRGTAISDLLESGRLPSHAAIRSWVSDGAVTQLALPDLVDPFVPTTPADALIDAEVVLARHLEAVRSIRELIRPHVASDTAARAESILVLAAAHPRGRLVVFAHHADTIRALYASLRSSPGTVAITGARVRAAAGRWSREEVLGSLGAPDRDLQSGDSRRIRIVLATDVVSEGVEMQGAGIIVHADLPWTPARVEQRVGRLARIGSRAEEIVEARFATPTEARPLLRLARRLLLKSAARRDALSASTARGRLDELLRAWRDRLPSVSGATGEDPITATVLSPIRGFVAVGSGSRGAILVCGSNSDGTWRVSSKPRFALRICNAANGESIPNDVGTEREILSLIERVLGRRRARERIGGRTGAAKSVSARLCARLNRGFSALSAVARAQESDRHRELLLAAQSRFETAREVQLAALLRDRHSDEEFLRRLRFLLKGSETPEPVAGVEQPRLYAVLILIPASTPRPEGPAPAPPIASR